MAVDLGSEIAIGERRSFGLTSMTVWSLILDCDVADGRIDVNVWDLMSGSTAIWIPLYSVSRN